jgi:prepilin-type N-terminal cleavage/methylation domain-containing protein
VRSTSTSHPPKDAQRGVSLIELMMALVVLSLGLLAVSQIFPAGTRGQVRDRLYSSGNYYAQEKLEELQAKTWSDPELTPGRHPAGSAVDSLGTLKTWRRFHEVEAMASPLDNLRKATVTVFWTNLGDTQTVRVSTYVRR